MGETGGGADCALGRPGGEGEVKIRSSFEGRLGACETRPPHFGDAGERRTRTAWLVVSGGVSVVARLSRPPIRP